MKNFKKLTALATAATMLISGSLTAFAAEEVNSSGGDTGQGGYEGFVDKTSAFSVDVPTDAANVFDFFVDPNGLLEATDYAHLGEDVSEDDFEDGATLFFTRTVTGSVTEKYGKNSDSVTLTNRSSYEVNVEVSATITGADGITLSDSDEITGDDPTLYLAIVADDGDDTTVPIISTGGVLTGTIDGQEDNFEVQWDADGQKYVFRLIKDTDEENPTIPWETLSFNLTGACGGKWTDAQADVAPVVSLTWKITDPKAAPTLTLSNGTASSDPGVDFDVTFTKGTASTYTFTGLGDGVTLSSVTWGASATDITSVSANLPLSGASFTINGVMWGSASSGDAKYIKLTTSDSQTFVIKVIIA